MNKKCPKCGNKLVDIAYGFPMPEAFEAEDKREIYLGGCEIFENSPKYHCYNCALSFSEDLSKSFSALSHLDLDELDSEI